MIGQISPMIQVIIVLAGLILALLAASLKILNEYERGVIFFLGHFTHVMGPGPRFVIPGIQRLVRIDLRTVVMDVPGQDVISQDNVSVRVNAVIYYRVIDPEKSVLQVEDFNAATSQLAQTTLRSVLGQHELDGMLSQREKLNASLQSILDSQTDAWGIKVSNVELKHVDLDDSMIRAIARQAEAERDRRARIIHADGEFQASQKLLDAANIIAQRPETMQIRYLQSLSDITNDKTSTIVFPFPMEMLQSLFDGVNHRGKAAASGGGESPATDTTP